MIRRDNRPLVAVIGSVDPARELRPPLRDTATAPAASAQLGAALARDGFDLVLFSSKPKYVESMVAEGYVGASTAGRPGRIVARPAQHQEFTLSLPADPHVSVETQRGTSGEWELSFFRALREVDGVVLVGGGRSTRVAGIVAIAQGVPVLPLAGFGGGAEQVRVNLDRERDRVSDDDIALLGAPWSPTSADALVACLRRQIRHRNDERAAADKATRKIARSATWGRIVAAAALIAALAGIALAGGPSAADTAAISLLLVTPMLAAIAGAIIWDSFGVDQEWSRAAVRGLGAGVVTVLLYVASQLLAVPDLLDQLDARRLLFFVVPLGFVAGLTFDLVYDRLRKTPELSDISILRQEKPQ